MHNDCEIYHHLRSIYRPPVFCYFDNSTGKTSDFIPMYDFTVQEAYFISISFRTVKCQMRIVYLMLGP